eukprot:CAMPEP_0204323776 /NCGR_PEP_ID=MMETSP0469-20131031/9698_1 /ASSEMBLY_ACC=CAM_ASM_000384 /TAXON_ID=2969 /ORGANISM="Oxyrrhis marina" /LENGTH=229 /DNA_ID=CAMNT_0051305309 /DNA_START=80 /DNA_END=767 /DNA_ORIENTATION=+
MSSLDFAPLFLGGTATAGSLELSSCRSPPAVRPGTRQYSVAVNVTALLGRLPRALPPPSSPRGRSGGVAGVRAVCGRGLLGGTSPRPGDSGRGGGSTTGAGGVAGPLGLAPPAVWGLRPACGLSLDRSTPAVCGRFLILGPTCGPPVSPHTPAPAAFTTAGLASVGPVTPGASASSEKSRSGPNTPAPGSSLPEVGERVGITAAADEASHPDAAASHRPHRPRHPSPSP